MSGIVVTVVELLHLPRWTRGRKSGTKVRSGTDSRTGPSQIHHQILASFEHAGRVLESWRVLLSYLSFRITLIASRREIRI